MNILFNEDGQSVQTFGEYIYIIPSTAGYYLFDVSDTETKVYEIPGTGTTDIEETTTPVRQSNVRKVIENGQMYIILDGVKYTVTGSTTL